MEHRLGQKHRGDADQPLANVFGGQRDPFQLDVVHLDVILDRLDDAGSEAGFVRAAGVRADAVDVAHHALVGGLGPQERELHFVRAEFLVDREKLLVDRLALVVLHDLLQIGRDAVGVMVLVRFLLEFVVEDDLQPAMHERDVFQMLLDDVAVEVCAAKNLLVRAEEDAGAAASERPQLLDRPGGFTASVRLLIFVAVAMHGRDQLLRQRVNHRRSDAVQAAAASVIFV